ncbi:Major facilitator superfamily multidrug transporter mfsB [Cladobotryum mycophilum]|uniref:Major facilitator superfamily multidrug transporter mfsB n=1 Tax=Cladobotryum mycophilum TaxID=491253 RepID=A0ABR0SKR8_9HYPO
MTRGADSVPKLPVRQLAILAVVRFAEPVASTSVFPYLPHMIRDFGVPLDKVAKWAGLTSAIFSLCQSVAAVPWGKASDRFGRKPILVWGLISTTICFLVWGMSTSLPMALTVRAIEGAGNGNVGIIRTMVAEMVTHKELQPKAFSIMPLVWSLGSVVGPAFGGFFAQPAERFPNVFGHIEFFKRFPYALPNFIATFFFFISASSAILFLKETHPEKRDEKDWGLLVGERLTRAIRRDPGQISQRRVSFVDGEATAPLIPTQVTPTKNLSRQPAPGMKEVFTRQTVINLACYTFLAFHSVAFDQNLTVLLYYPVIPRTPENTKFPFYFTGGLGLDSGTIGTFFTLYGLTCGSIQFLLFPPLVRRYGVHNCFKLCSVITPVVYLLTPYTSLFPTPTTRYLAVLAVMVLKAFSIIIAFPATTILLTNSATSVRILGTLNGFATMFSCLGRALGPATTGLVFSWGAQHGYIVSAYFFLAFIAAIGAIPAFWIVEGSGPSASVESTDSSDTEGDEAFATSQTVFADSEDDEEATASSPLLKGNQKNYSTTN